MSFVHSGISKREDWCRSSNRLCMLWISTLRACGCSCSGTIKTALSQSSRPRSPLTSAGAVQDNDTSSKFQCQHAMNALHYAGRLYSLDTLDTRFTASSKTPPSKIDPARPSPDEPGQKRPSAGTHNVAQEVAPSKWRTPEYLYHGLVFLVAVPLMFKTVYDLSKGDGLCYNISDGCD